MSQNGSGEFLDPGKMLDYLDMKTGNTVADFGCGGGHFSLEAARRVGDTGTVWAFDILPSAIEAVESTVKMEGLKHIITKRANLELEEGSGLKEDSADIVIVKDILYQNDDKEKILSEASRVLKSDGQLLVIEWGEKNGTLGPEDSRRISRETLKELLEKVGFSVKDEVSAGEYHYAFFAQKK